MKIVYVILGTLSLTLGLIGIFLPLLPTTPFLLLAAALYFRGSPRMYQWLIRQKYLGSYIRQFREQKAIPLRAKCFSIALIWLTLGYCALRLTSATGLRLLFLVIAVGTTCYLLSFKTLRR